MQRHSMTGMNAEAKDENGSTPVAAKVAPNSQRRRARTAAAQQGFGRSAYSPTQHAGSHVIGTGTAPITPLRSVSAMETGAGGAGGLLTAAPNTIAGADKVRVVWLRLLLLYWARRLWKAGLLNGSHLQATELGRAILARMPGATSETIFDLSVRIETQLKLIESLREENTMLKTGQSRAEAELNTQAEAAAVLAADNASLQRQLSKAGEERQGMQAQVSVLESQLRSANAKIEAQAAQLAQQQQLVEGMEGQLAAARKEVTQAVEARLQASKHHHEEIRIMTDEYTRRMEEETAKARRLEENSRAQTERLREVEQDLVELRTAAERLKQSEKQYGEKQLETLQLVRDALESKLQKEIDQRESAIAELKQMLESTRRESFQHLACAIKLSLCMAGQTCNLDIQSLWDRMTAANIAPAEWNAWISTEMTRAADELQAKMAAEEREAAALRSHAAASSRSGRSTQPSSQTSGRRSHVSINGEPSTSTRATKRSRFSLF